MQAKEAADAAKVVAALPPLELISRPEQKKTTKTDPSNPASWGVIDFKDFAAQNPAIAARQLKSSKRWAALNKNKLSPQLPPPPLADRPARPPPGSVRPAAPVGSILTSSGQHLSFGGKVPP